MGITKHSSSEQKTGLTLKDKKVKSGCFTVNYFQGPHHPSSSALPSSFLNLVFRASFLAPWRPCLQSKPQSVSPLLSSLSMSVCLWILWKLPIVWRGAGRLGPTPSIISTQSEDCPVVGLGLVCRLPAPARPRDSPGLPDAIIVTAFTKSRGLNVLLHCSRPGGPAAFCFHRLPGASPSSPPIDCTRPHCQAGKLF